ECIRADSHCTAARGHPPLIRVRDVRGDAVTEDHLHQRTGAAAAMRITRLACAALLLAATSATASAQSLFATRGLGVPVLPVDARGAALGATGIGLLGFHTSMVNPAELAGISRRGVSAALQPVSTSVDVDGAEDGTSGTRFPLLNVLYPVSGRLVLSLGYGGYLDQTWGIVSESEQL